MLEDHRAKLSGPYGPASVWVHKWAWVERPLHAAVSVVLLALEVWAVVALLQTVAAPLVLLGLAIIMGRGLLYLILRFFDPR